MITLFIFKSNSRAIKYGIGTYLDHLIKSLLDNYNLSIITINYYSSVKEYAIKNINNSLIEIFIPSPQIYYTTSLQEYKYAARVLDLISGLFKHKKCCFLVNQIDAFPIVKLLKVNYNYPVISVIHSAQWQILFNGNKKKFNDEWGNKLNTLKFKPIQREKELYELSDKVISVTDYMKQFVIEYYGIPVNKLKVIKNGVDANCYHPIKKDEKSRIKNELGFNSKDKIVLFSGRLDTSKGINFLINGFQNVFNIDKNIHLVIIGESVPPDSIEKFLAFGPKCWANITFTGFLGLSDLIKFYEIADVGVIPSIYDHCPFVALEMISFNIPLIISNTEGLNEILTKNQAIYIEPKYEFSGEIYFDPLEISNAIISVLNSKDLKNIMTKDYPKLARHYSLIRMAKKTYSVLQELN